MLKEQTTCTDSEMQIINAKTAYIMKLNGGTGSATRFAIYTDNGNGLQVLWAKELNYDNLNKSKLFPYQTHSKVKGLPAFHFRVRGYGLSRSYELVRMLQNYNPDIKVFCINGWAPSSSF